MKRRRSVSERVNDSWKTARIALGVTVIALATCIVIGSMVLEGVFEKAKFEAIASESRRDRALWELPLLYRIGRATRLTVVSGIHSRSPYSPNPQAEVLFEIVRVGLGREFVSPLWVDTSISGGICGCAPVYYVNFFEDDRLLAYVGFSHDLTLRSDGWTLNGEVDDGRVSEESAENIANWFSDLGTSFLSEHRKEIHRIKEIADRNPRDSLSAPPPPPPVPPVPPPSDVMDLLTSIDHEEPNQLLQAKPANAAAPDL